MKVLQPEQFEELKVILSHRVKLRMKLNLLGRMSSVAESRPGSMSFKSAPASRQTSKESLDADSSRQGTALTMHFLGVAPAENHSRAICRTPLGFIFCLFIILLLLKRKPDENQKLFFCSCSESV